MSKNGGSHGPQGPWAQNHQIRKIIKIIKNHENLCFFEHGKDAHQHFEKGALNDSSRSLIWSFLEQIVFLEIGEKVSKLSKLGQFWDPKKGAVQGPGPAHHKLFHLLLS